MPRAADPDLGPESRTPSRRRPPPIPVPTARPGAGAARPGAGEARPASTRILGRGEAQVVRRELDDAMLESLEELLIASDMGVDTALRVTANLAEGRLGKRLSVDEIKALLADEIARIMEPVARPMPLYPSRPQVVLVVGVNGSGKTTTIGKLASQFRAAGKTVVIAAGDTFRAAAVEQLKVWGERAGVPVMTAAQGSDPASLAFDAMTRAEAEGADLLLIDTAGRLQNRQDLMEELAKIVRVIRKKDPTAPHNTLLVLDATTGQNALSQVETFRRLADVTGAGDDQARRHRQGRRAGGAGRPVRPADPCHRRRRADRRSGAVRSRRLRPGADRGGGMRLGHGRRSFLGPAARPSAPPPAR